MLDQLYVGNKASVDDFDASVKTCTELLRTKILM